MRRYLIASLDWLLSDGTHVACALYSASFLVAVAILTVATLVR